MHKPLRWVIFLCFSLGLNPLALADRTFTSTEGKELQAEIVSTTETHVTLKKTKDGKDYQVPLERLSKKDQEYITEWREKLKTNTRSAKKIILSFKGGKTKEVDIPQGEYLSKDGILTLYPGEKIHIEFQDVDGKLGQPEVVAAITDPKRSISLSMSQKEGITMLYRESKMQQTVAMDCEHRGIGSDEFFRTNLFPTEKGLVAGDSWPDTVWTLKLKNFEVTDKPASKVYEERIAK